MNEHSSPRASSALAVDQLSRWAASVRAGDIPAPLRTRAALVLKDTVAGIAAGAHEPEVKRLIASIGDDGPAPIIGAGRHVSAGVAALINGIAGTSLEVDEGHRFAGNHPGIHVIPALLSAIATTSVRGADFLTAFIVGYEIGARIGQATSLRPAMHTHGSWGAIASAGALVKLAGGDAATLRESMSLAANFSLATSRRTMLEGATVRNAFAGVSAQLGLTAVSLQRAGFTADDDGIGIVFGKVLSDRFEPERLTTGLGDSWEIERNYFRLHACCRLNHAAADAAIALHGDFAQVSIDEISEIVVETYRAAIELDEPHPKNVLASRFSVPFIVANALLFGRADHDDLNERRLADKRLHAIAATVRLKEDPEMTAKAPVQRPARVTVMLADGRVLSASVTDNKGDPENPYSAEDLARKYDSLASRVWSVDHATRVAGAIDALDEAPRCDDFVALLAK